jgi:hypothetical protein
MYVAPSPPCGPSREHPTLSEDKLFEKWTGTLYEARWGAVCRFIRDVSPLLPVLAASYESAKFKSGVDFLGATVSHSSPTATSRPGLLNSDPVGVTFSKCSHLVYYFFGLLVSCYVVSNCMQPRDVL